MVRSASAARSATPTKLDIDITVPDQRDARLARNRRLPLGEAERYALDELRKLGGAIRTVDAKDVPRFASAVSGFDDRLEATVAANGWFREPPGDSVGRWSRRAAVVLVAGLVGVFFGVRLPSNGLLLVGVAAVVGAIAMFVIARVMPQRTLEGARTFAQLAAYRRTLQKTLEQSRTMDQVVASGALPWVETPDQAVVWAYALGLHEEAEEVLERSMEDVRTGAASPTRTYFPLWFAIGERSGGRISGGRAGAHGRPLLERRGARLHGHDGGPGDDRQPAGIVGRRRGGPAAAASAAAARAAVAAAPAAASSVGLAPMARGGRATRLDECLVCGHGCDRHDGDLLRATQRRRPPGCRGPHGRARRDARPRPGQRAHAARRRPRWGAGSCAPTRASRWCPADVRETGNTYEADLLVLRPGVPSQHIDAIFRVEAGQDHQHQLLVPLGPARRRRPSPLLAAGPWHPAAAAPGLGDGRRRHVAPARRAAEAVGRDEQLLALGWMRLGSVMTLRHCRWRMLTSKRSAMALSVLPGLTV